MIRSPRLLPALPLILALAASVFLAGESRAFRVSGTVRNPNGQGVAGVDIDARNASTGASVALANDGTTANGSYSVFLPPGAFHLRFTPPPAVPLVAQERRNIVVMNQVNLDVTLPGGFFLFGTVRDPALVPIAGIDIDVRDAVTQAELFIGNDDTDANGFYVVALPNGTYKVLIRPNPSTSYPVRVFDNIVISNSDRNLNAVLQNGVRIFGTATGPEGDPLPGVDLDIFDPGTGARVWTFGSGSDSLGFYQAAVLSGASYNLLYQGPEPWGYQDLAVDSLFVSGHTQRDVQLDFPYTLAGVVQSASGGNPLSSVHIDVFSHAVGDKIPLGGNQTDLNGQYDVRVPQGTVDVTFRSPEGNGYASAIFRNIQISDDTQLDAQLVPGFALAGRVRRPNGTGVAGVDFDVEDPLTGLEVPVFDDNTDALGDYTLVLPQGTYNLDIDPGHGVRLVAQVLNGVAAPHAGALDFQLQTGVLLSGRVIDHVSNPWPDIDLDVRIAGTATEIVTPGDDTDGNGNYLVTVPVGTYDLAFDPPFGIPVQSGLFEDVMVSGDLVYDAVLTNTVIAVTEDAGSAPVTGRFILEPSIPNPFNPTTAIGFILGEASPVTLRIYDVEGRVVRTLYEGRLAAGRHVLPWDGRDGRGGRASSGVYFLRLTTAGGARSQKLILTR